jgi:phosphoserine aminotransferase
MQKIYLSPGPSQLYFTVDDHVKKAMKNQIGSISHRSSAFKSIYQETVESLKALLQLPESHHIIFTASATEIWERLIQNCVESSSLHAVNGEFSARFHQFALLLGKKADKYEVSPGLGVEIEKIPLNEGYELIALTHNETSTGVAMSMEAIKTARKRYPEALIAVDAVSSVPFPEFPWDSIDTLYFSVQKGLGLPAGLGVWVVNDRCLQKAIQLKSKGISIGTYRTLPEMIKKSTEFQTVETPNVLGIYLAGKISSDMLGIGLELIRRDTRYKAALLYHTFDSISTLNPFVKATADRSLTVTVAEIKGGNTSLLKKLDEKGIVIGSGYGPFKTDHIRIANFPAHSKEQIELFVDYLKELS